MKNLNCKICNIRPKAKKRTICETCKSRKFRENNKELMVWHYIKESAKKRNIFFDLPKKEFIKWLQKNNYTSNSGRLRDNFTLDRINGCLGYEMNNIQILTRIENINKYHNIKEEYPF